jgi:hypothetical protein
MYSERQLKRDSFGAISLRSDRGRHSVVRDTAAASYGLRWLAAALARREAAALGALEGQPGFPRLIGFDGRRLLRSFLPGAPLHAGPPPTRGYFREAFRMLVRLHRLGITHNDLAKEGNWIRQTDGRPGIVDFQLASRFRHRGTLFRTLAREDLRHLLKHKRHYCSEHLTPRQHALLANPSAPARLWRRLVKPPYRFVTRRILGWPERTGPVERTTRKGR